MYPFQQLTTNTPNPPRPKPKRTQVQLHQAREEAPQAPQHLGWEPPLRRRLPRPPVPLPILPTAGAPGIEQRHRPPADEEPPEPPHRVEDGRGRLLAPVAQRRFVGDDERAEEPPRGQGGVGAGGVERDGVERVAERGPALAEAGAGQGDAEGLVL